MNVKQAWIKDLEKTVSVDSNLVKMSSFYKMMKPLLIGYKIFGRLPYILSKEGKMETKLFSWCSLYWLIFFSSLSFLAIENLMAIVEFLKNEKQYLLIVQCILNMIVLVYHFTLPISVYLESSNICNYLNNWADYQSCLEKIMGQKCTTKSHNWFKLLLYTMPFIVAGIILYERNVFYNVAWYHLIVYACLFVVCHLNIFFWIFSLIEIGHAASILKIEIKKKIRHSTSSQIYNYRLIWLKINKLLESISNAVPFSMLVMTTVNHACFVISAFVLISSFIQGRYEGIQFLGIMAITGTMTVSTLEAGECASKKVGKDIADVLMGSDITNMDNQAIREMNLFIQTVSRSNSDVTFGSYVNINRSALTGMFGSTVTYLIVLVQFNQSPH